MLFAVGDWLYQADWGCVWSDDEGAGEALKHLKGQERAGQKETEMTGLDFYGRID